MTPLAPLVVLLAALGAAGWWTADALVLAQTVSEGRTVADMAENVGRWASQYGGVHVRTQGADARIPGSFLTRSVYAASDGDAALLQGSRTGQGEREAMQRVEAYHWKNPALVQRELADVIASSGSKARYRMTARSVLNRSNAPNAFELQALDTMQSGGGKEFWTVQAGQLLYARAVVAQKSCLNCHASAEKAPAFIRTNEQFNGGGGYGYVEGRPAGVISVSVPLPPAGQALVGSVPLAAWAALGMAALAAGWLALSVRARAPARR